MKTVITTLTFEVSPSQSCGDPGPNKPAYVVAEVVDGVRRPERIIPCESEEAVRKAYWKQHLTVEAEVGAFVQLFIAYRNGAGHCSPARQLKFVVRDIVLPDSPGVITIRSTRSKVSLPVLA